MAEKLRVGSTNLGRLAFVRHRPNDNLLFSALNPVIAGLPFDRWDVRTIKSDNITLECMLCVQLQ